MEWSVTYNEVAFARTPSGLPAEDGRRRRPPAGLALTQNRSSDSLRRLTPGIGRLSCLLRIPGCGPASWSRSGSGGWTCSAVPLGWSRPR